MTLKISISGIRGIAGQSLTDEVVRDFAAAFAKYTNKGKIVIGSDTRLSGEHVKTIVISELCARGCEVIDIGIAPTPTTQIAVRNNKADGGIIITASHNPPEWNGLKFVRQDGIFLNESQAKELISMYEDIQKTAKAPKEDSLIGSLCKKDPTALDKHIELVKNNIDVPAIRNKGFKVAIDCCNGAGSVITQKFLKELGCEIIAINTDTKKIPPRGSEPIPQNLSQLCEVVKKFNADIGFAQDPDADRLSIVSDEGVAIGEEYSLALAAMFILSRDKSSGKKVLVTNLSTSRINEDIASGLGAKVVRTKVGEVNVSEKIKETGAVIGGEGNGGIIWPVVGLGRDSIAGIGLILTMLAASGKKLSFIVSGMPRYSMIKDKVELSASSDPSKILSSIEKLYTSEKIDRTDGIKVDFSDGWLHIRSSNTEPIIRIIAEGLDIKVTKNRIEEVKRAVLSL